MESMLSRSAVGENQGPLQTKSAYNRLYIEELVLNLPVGYIPKVRSSEFKTYSLLETLIELVCFS